MARQGTAVDSRAGGDLAHLRHNGVLQYLIASARFADYERRQVVLERGHLNTESRGVESGGEMLGRDLVLDLDELLLGRSALTREALFCVRVQLVPNTSSKALLRASEMATACVDTLTSMTPSWPLVGPDDCPLAAGGPRSVSRSRTSHAGQSRPAFWPPRPTPRQSRRSTGSDPPISPPPTVRTRRGGRRKGPDGRGRHVCRHNVVGEAKPTRGPSRRGQGSRSATSPEPVHSSSRLVPSLSRRQV